MKLCRKNRDQLDQGRRGAREEREGIGYRFRIGIIGMHNESRNGKGNEELRHRPGLGRSVGHLANGAMSGVVRQLVGVVVNGLRRCHQPNQQQAKERSPAHDRRAGISFLKSHSVSGSGRLGLSRRSGKQDPILTLDDDPEYMVLSLLLQASKEELSFIIPRDSETQPSCSAGLKREVLIN